MKVKITDFSAKEAIGKAAKPAWERDIEGVSWSWEASFIRLVVRLRGKAWVERPVFRWAL
ncbi:MAG: hypothetical protein HY611_00345 [Elusimicrobia bacterium]|nr:hypothetical protein [Elusimicrobiota bacterium]